MNQHHNDNIQHRATDRNARLRAVTLAKQMYERAMNHGMYVSPYGIIAPVGDGYECSIIATGYVVWLTDHGTYSKSRLVEFAACEA